MGTQPTRPSPHVWCPVDSGGKQRTTGRWGGRFPPKWVGYVCAPWLSCGCSWAVAVAVAVAVEAAASNDHCVAGCGLRVAGCGLLTVDRAVDHDGPLLRAVHVVVLKA